MNSLAEALAALHRVRPSSASLPTRREAKRVARAPFVHRFGVRGRPPWRQVLDDRELRGVPARTECERSAGAVDVVYFFLGSGAYALGQVALILDHDFVCNAAGTATPFDTGACAHHENPVYLERRGTPFGSPTERSDHLRAHMLADCRDTAKFAEEYIPAHFDDPREYLRRPQRSTTDHPTYHALESPNQDRRAWTIEVQRWQSVAILPDPRTVRCIVVTGQAMLAELPLDYRRLALIAVPPQTLDDVIANFCERTLT